MKKVIIIEDSPTFCNMLGKKLEAKGWKTILCYNYRDGLKAVRESSPDFDKMCTYKITYPNFQAFSKNNLCKWVTQRLFFVSLHHVCT